MYGINKENRERILRFRVSNTIRAVVLSFFATLIGTMDDEAIRNRPRGGREVRKRIPLNPK